MYTENGDSSLKAMVQKSIGEMERREFNLALCVSTGSS